MLAKGPVAPFLAAVIVIIFAAAKGDYRLMARTCWLPGIALFALTVLPWYVAVQLRNPEFFRVFILEHNLATIRERPLSPHPAFLVLPACRPARTCALDHVCQSRPWRKRIRAWWREKKELFQSEDALPVFLVIWLVVPVAFFSFSASKLPGYILPALPAGTLLLAEYVRRQRRCDDDRPSLVLIVMHSMVAALPVVAALMMQYIVFQHTSAVESRDCDLGRICGSAGDRNHAHSAPPARPSPVALRHAGSCGAGGGSCLAAGRSRARCHALRASAGPGDQPRGQPVASPGDSAAFTRDRIWSPLLSQSEDCCATKPEKFPPANIC